MGAVEVKTDEEGEIGSLLRLVVSEKHKRKKIGSTLVKACEDWARKKGCTTMRLGVSDVKDAPLPQKMHLYTMYTALGYTASEVKPLSDLFPKAAEIEVVPTIVTLMTKIL